MNRNRNRILAALISSPLAIAGCAVTPEQSSQDEAPDAVQQELQPAIDLCSETGVPPHATINQVDVYHTSPNDQYTYGIGCKGYIVEYTNATDANMQGFSGGWEYASSSQFECQRLRATYTLYSYNNGTWTTNGTAKFHGVWTTGSFGGCYQILDTGSTVPRFSAGTKWRARVAAWDRNCVGDSCSNDYKRVFAWLQEPPH